MAFNIQNFTDRFGQQGVIQTNKFEVRVFPRLVGPAGSQIITRDSIERLTQINEQERNQFRNGLTIIRDRVQSVKLPGVVIDNIENRRYGVGPRIKTATNVNFEPFSISILNDANFDTHKFFYTWLNAVFDFGTGLYSSGGTFVGARNRPSYLTSYKSEYAMDTHVYVYDNNGRLKAEYIFQESYPIALSDPGLGWGDNNTLYKFDVSLAYTGWVINTIPNYTPGATAAI